MFVMNIQPFFVIVKMLWMTREIFLKTALEFTE